MGFSIAEMLSGNIVQPRQAPQDNSSAGLGQMLQFLMNSNQQPVAQVPEAKYPSLSELASISAGRRKEKQQADATEQMRQLIGTRPVMGVDSADPVLANGLPGTGYLGGKTSEGDLYANMMASADENIARNGAQLFSDYKKPLARPTLHSMGVPNMPGYKVNFYLDNNNQPVPVGEPFKSGEGVNINMGDGQPSFLTEQQKKEAGINPTSVVTVNPKNGSLDVVQQVQKPSDKQLEVAANADMEQLLERQLKDLTTKGYDPSAIDLQDNILGEMTNQTGVFGSPVAAFSRRNMSPNALEYRRVQNTWIENFGRDKSGGAITEEEYPNWRNTYFPQQGDSSEQITKKDTARASYMRGLKTRSGVVDEQGNNSSGALKSAKQFLEDQ